MNRVFVISVLMVLLFGCFQPATKTAGINEEFTLKINETASIPSEGLSITLVDVPEDSRCPSSVQCVWAGRTTVEFQVKKGNADLGRFNATSEPGASGTAVAVSGYLIRVIGVSPYPGAPSSIQKSDYTVTMEVVKATSLG
ncbi:MAG: hypothetical protein V1827_00500 [Candidatus Micrarchaeota archaeon]